MLDALATYMCLFSGLQGSYVSNDLNHAVSTQTGKLKTAVKVVSTIPSKPAYVDHLNGKLGIGICPIDASNNCSFAALDIDCYDKEKLQYLLNVIHQFDLPFIPFKSKSGGLHLYIFLRTRVKANLVRKALKRFIDIFSLDITFNSEGTSLVELFPKQDVLPQNGKGSYITLPYFNHKDSKTPMVSFDFQDVDFRTAMAVLPDSATTLKELDEKLDSLPYEDAPICIQKALLSFLKKEKIGRNDFLFSVAIYIKKKNGSVKKEDLEEINNRFYEPLTEQEIVNILNSVDSHGYKYKCSGAICKKYCDKKLCAKKEFGIGKVKGHFTGIDFGQLIRMDSKDPYYLWELRASEELPFTKVMFKDEEELTDQKKFLVNCVRFLNVAPAQVSTNDWLEIVNKSLAQMIVQQVSITSDTTESNQIYKAFINFLVTKKAVNSKPYMVRIGNVYKNDIGEYYFTADGFINYLTSKKLFTKSLVIREILTHFGCTETNLSLRSSIGETKIPCWKKQSDENLELEESFLDSVIEGDKESIREMLDATTEEVNRNESDISF